MLRNEAGVNAGVAASPERNHVRGHAACDRAARIQLGFARPHACLASAATRPYVANIAANYWPGRGSGPISTLLSPAAAFRWQLMASEGERSSGAARRGPDRTFRPHPLC